MTPNDEALSPLPGGLRSDVGAWADGKQAVGPFLQRKLKEDGVTGTTATLLYLAAASGSINTELAITAAMMSS